MSKSKKIDPKFAEKRPDFDDPASQVLARKDVLFGQQVGKFPARKMMAAQSLGLRFFKLSDAEREQLSDTNFLYDGIFWDATVVAWLAICAPVEVFQALRTPAAVADKIMAWSEEKKVAPGEPAFNEVMEYFGQIIADMTVSHAEPIESPNVPAGPRDQMAGE